jgi:hypothetical protein
MDAYTDAMFKVVVAGTQAAPRLTGADYEVAPPSSPPVQTQMRVDLSSRNSNTGSAWFARS